MTDTRSTPTPEFTFVVVTEKMVTARNMTLAQTIGHADATCSNIDPATVVWSADRAPYQVEEFDGDPWPCMCAPLPGRTPRRIGFDPEPELPRTGAGRTVQPSVQAATLEEVVAAVRSLPHGEKFGADDVTPAMAAWATEWAKSYAGTFEFMVDMRKAAIKRTLSPGQAKGTLNCFRADYWRTELAKKEVKPAAESAPSVEHAKGDVHIVDGEFYRVHIGQSSGMPYAVKAKIVTPATWNDDGSLDKAGVVEWEMSRGMIRRLDANNAATPEQAKQFSRLAGRCCFCSTPIDTPESTLVGYGPTCALKRRLPWGATTDGG